MCANAEFSPEEMRLYKWEFHYQSAELKGISNYKQTHLHIYIYI